MGIVTSKNRKEGGGGDNFKVGGRTNVHFSRDVGVGVGRFQTILLDAQLNSQHDFQMTAFIQINFFLHCGGLKSAKPKLQIALY